MMTREPQQSSADSEIRDAKFFAAIGYLSFLALSRFPSKKAIRSPSSTENRG